MALSDFLMDQNPTGRDQEFCSTLCSVAPLIGVAKSQVLIMANVSAQKQKTGRLRRNRAAGFGRGIQSEVSKLLISTRGILVHEEI